MIRSSLQFSGAESGIPRMSGDDPISPVSGSHFGMYSPHERG